MDGLMLNVIPNLRKYLIPLSFGLLGMIFLGYGLIQSSAKQNQQEDLMFVSGKDSAESVKSAVAESEITIDISGAVVSPGVYTLTDGARIKDAIEKAGGLSDSADMDFVNRSFNLAAKLQDGSKLYIPEVGESIGSTTSNVAVGSSNASGVSVSGLININSASESELDTLSGVGPVTAGKIIDNRPYTSLEELVSKKAVSQSVLEKIKDSISLY
jgi:competence protein ComEA